MLTPEVGAQDHAQASAGARVTLVEYGDYECPYCGRAYPVVKALQERLGDGLRFVFRNFPLAQVHPNAAAFAEFAEAAASQGKFWQAHDYLFEHQGQLSDQQLAEAIVRLGLEPHELARVLGTKAPAARVRADFASGVESGVNGTPTFFINGERFDGEWWDEGAFAEALTNAGVLDRRTSGVSAAPPHIAS